MGSIQLNRLCQDFEDCLGWPYRSPGGTGRDCSSSGIDCSGMFVRAYKLQGERIAHGSNTIWRKHLSAKGRLTDAGQLARGMAVFKHKAADTAKYPDGQGDFCHIGLVTSVHPLRIVHASTVGMKVKADTTLAPQWAYWGRLAAVDDEIPASAPPTIPADMPTLRKRSRGDAVVTLQLHLRQAGYALEPDGIFGDQTEMALCSYQASQGLAADGVAGPKTWAALRWEDAA